MDDKTLNQKFAAMVTRKEFANFASETSRRFDRIEGRLTKLDMLDKLIIAVDGLVGGVHDIQQEQFVMNHSLDRIEVKLDSHERRIQRLERMSGILKIEPAE